MKAKIKYFQEGGAMDNTQDQGQGGGDPQAQLTAMLQQYAQSHDPQLAIQIADMLVQAMGQQQATASQEQPQGGTGYAKNGGKLLSAADKFKAFNKSI